MHVVRILWPSAVIAMCGIVAGVCSDSELRLHEGGELGGEARLRGRGPGKLDREIARLFVLARRGPHMTPERQAGTDRHSARLDQGDATIAGSSPMCESARSSTTRSASTNCARATLTRARETSEGISKGPMSVECPDFDSRISATFIQTDPPIVYLTWREHVLRADARTVGIRGEVCRQGRQQPRGRLLGQRPRGAARDCPAKPAHVPSQGTGLSYNAN